MCHKDWYGTNCLVYCTATNNSRVHYECDARDGSKICHADFYGPNCSTHCVPKRSNIDGHYDCNIKDGSKICLLNWYGPNCSVYGTARNDSWGHYEYNAVDGNWSCLEELAYSQGANRTIENYRHLTHGENAKPHSNFPARG